MRWWVDWPAVAFGLAWPALFASSEWALGRGHIQWDWPRVAALIFIAVGPAVLAYRAWGVGRAGPAAAGFFSNLTRLFTALLSTAVLGEAPHLFHVLAFGLIVGGIVVSSRR